MALEKRAPAREFSTIELLGNPIGFFKVLIPDARWIELYLVTVFLAVVGGIMFVPAKQHILASQNAASAAIAFQPLLVPLLLVFSVTLGIIASFTLIMITSVFLGKHVKVAEAWAVANAISVVKLGFSTLTVGFVVAFVGADHFAVQSDLSQVLPSLEKLLPSDSPKIQSLYAVIDVFNIYSVALFTMALKYWMKVATIRAFIFAAILGVGPQLLLRCFANG